MANMDKSLKRAFIVIGIAFSALMGATVYTLKVALAGHEKVVDPAYYEKGNNYDKIVAQKKEFLKEGYDFYSPILEKRTSLHSGSNPVEIQFRKGDIPITDAIVVFYWERPATKKFDSNVSLVHSKDGIYTGNVQILSYGQWVLTVSAKVQDKVFQQSYTVIVAN